MLIPVLEDYYDRGYLPLPGMPALSPFFPNCNLAVRRAALEQAGGYDISMTAGEDADICRRIAISGWYLFYEPEAIVVHESRRTIPDLLRQWWTYGYAGAGHFHKARVNKLEIYWTTDIRPRVHRYRRLWAWRGCPFEGILFINYFTVLAGTFLAGLIATVAGALILGAILGCIGLLGFGSVMARRTRGHNPRARLLYSLLVLIMNSACIMGSIGSIFRYRKLFIYSGV